MERFSFKGNKHPRNWPRWGYSTGIAVSHWSISFCFCLFFVFVFCFLFFFCLFFFWFIASLFVCFSGFSLLFYSEDRFVTYSSLLCIYTWSSHVFSVLSSNNSANLSQTPIYIVRKHQSTLYESRVRLVLCSNLVGANDHILRTFQWQLNLVQSPFEKFSCFSRMQIWVNLLFSTMQIMVWGVTACLLVGWSFVEKGYIQMSCSHCMHLLETSTFSYPSYICTCKYINMFTMNWTSYRVW